MDCAMTLVGDSIISGGDDAPNFLISAQHTKEFTSKLLAFLDDCRFLWLPNLADTTTSTDESRHAATITWSESLASFDTARTSLGSGTAVPFNGTDEEGDTPDNDRLSFGDGLNDEPFSIVALVNLTDATSSVILAKFDLTTGSQVREWILSLNSADGPEFLLYDESLNAQIGRLDTTALTEGSWVLIVATYDGGGSAGGISIYVDAVRVDDTNNSSGAYTSMENTAQEIQLGFQTGASGVVNFFDGSMALVAVTKKQISPDEVWAIKELCNGYFNLDL